MQDIDLTHKEVFQKIGPDAIKNIIWFGLATAVIVVISKVSWWIGVILAGIYAIVAILDILRVGSYQSLHSLVLSGLLLKGYVAKIMKRV